MLTVVSLLIACVPQAGVNIPSQPYRWKSVAIGAGGFVSGIVFHPKQRGLAYVRTDIGGAYRWDARRHEWVPLQDWLKKEDWNLYGIESIGLDPTNPNRLYLACGTYTNAWGGNGAILRSNDQGRTFQRTDLPFKLGGNEDGRSMGERLAVDPNDARTVWFGTRNNGLWTSTDSAATWSESTTFPVHGRTNGIGTTQVVFDPTSSKPGSPTQTVFVGEAERTTPIYRTEDGGRTWGAVPGQPAGQFPHHMVLAADGTLLVTYTNGPGPNGVTDGSVWKFNTKSGTWSNITPIRPGAAGEHGFGYAGLTVDPHDPRLIMVSTLDRWNPGDDVFRSTDGGATWAGLREHSQRDASLAPYMKWGGKEASFGWWIGALALDPFNPSRVLYGTGANIWGCDDVSKPETHWTVAGTGIEETADIDLISPSEGSHLVTGLGDIGGFTHWDLNQTPPGMTMNPHLDNTDSLDWALDCPLLVVRAGRGKGKSGSYSYDGGVTWNEFPTEPPHARGGSIVWNSTAQVMVWSTGGATWRSFDFGKTWTGCRGLTGNLDLVGDGVTPTRIYALAGSQLYMSDDTGGKFDVLEAAGLPAVHGRIKATNYQVGDLWVPAETGLFHSVDAGHVFQKLPGVDAAESVGFGKPAPGKRFPTVFLNGKVSGISGVFRSDDEARTWVRISDSAHEYGTRGIVIGDPRIYGRVYLGTNGRGVFYGDPK